MSSLPVVAPGENPYSVYLTLLDDEIYRHPTAGFKARISLLLALNALYTLLALVYLVLLVFDSKRLKPGMTSRQGFWLFRRVQRTSGYYVVTNQRVATALSTIVNGAVSLPYLVNAGDVYIRKGSQSQLYGWQGFVFVPLFVAGWLTCFGAFQAFILTTDHSSRFVIPAWAANLLFMGLGTALCLTGIGSAVVYKLAGTDLYNKYVVFRDSLQGLESSYTGATTTADYLTLAPSYLALQNTATHLTMTATWFFSVILVLPLIILLVNLGALGLMRVLKQQIVYKRDQLSRANFPSVDGHGNGSRSGAAGHSHSSGNGVARRKGSDGGNHMSNQINTLKKARTDLLVIAVSVAVVTTIISGILILIIVACRTNRINDGGWALYEVTFTSINWIYTVAVLVSLSLLIFNQLATSDILSSPENHVDTYIISTTGVAFVSPPQSPLMDGAKDDREPRFKSLVFPSPAEKRYRDGHERVPLEVRLHVETQTMLDEGEEVEERRRG